MEIPNTEKFSPEDFSISTDVSKLDIDLIHRYLSEESYWAKGIPLPVVEHSIAHSLCFGVFHFEKQVGFARVVSDYAILAYLADVFILEKYRGLGLSRRLMETILAHAYLQNLRRWLLMTQDAHFLYEKFGFTPLSKPENAMEIARPGIYGKEKFC